MNVTLSRASLLAITEATSKVAGLNPPICSCVRLSVSGNVLTASATDLTVFANKRVVVDRPVKAGPVCVSARKLHDAARALADGPVTLTTDKTSLVIGSGRSKTKLLALPDADFPDPPTAAPTATVDMAHGSILADAISLVRFCCSNDGTRRSLGAVRFRGTKQGLELAATDGHRLSVVLIDTAAEGVDALVPAEALDRMLPMLTKTVALRFSRGFVQLTSSCSDLITRLVDDDFPDVARVIPQSSAVSMTIRSGDLAHALRRVSVVASERARGIRLTRGQGGDLIVSACSPDHGEASDAVTVLSGDEGQVAVGLSSKYLAEFLSAVPDRPIRIGFGSDDSSPIVGACVELPTFRHVIMPMRL